MAKKFPITGKGVFKDRQEQILYAKLTDGSLITVENNAEAIAIIAWHETVFDQRREFLKRYFGPKFVNAHLVQWHDLPIEVQNKIIEYQKEKLNLA